MAKIWLKLFYDLTMYFLLINTDALPSISNLNIKEAYFLRKF